MNILSSKSLDIPKKNSFNSSINILSKKFSINCKSKPNKYYESAEYRLSQNPPIYFYRKITKPYKYNISNIDLSYSNRKSNEDIFAEKVKNIINKELGDSINLNNIFSQSLKNDRYKPKGYPYFEFVNKHHNMYKKFFLNKQINKDNFKEKNIIVNENEKNIMNNSSKYLMNNQNINENNEGRNLNNIQIDEVNNNKEKKIRLEKEKIQNLNEKKQKNNNINENEINKYENNHNINYNENIKNDNKNEDEYFKKEDISQLNHNNSLQDNNNNYNTNHNLKTNNSSSILYPILSEKDEIKYKYYESDPHNLKNDTLFKNKSGEKNLFRNNFQLKDFDNKLHITSDSNSSWIPKIPKRITYNNLSSVKYNIISPLRRSIFKTREEISGLKIANRVKSVSQFVDISSNKTQNLNELFENSIKVKNWFMKRNQVASNQGDLHHTYKEIIPYPFS